jgi:hypothetical protein
VTQSWATRLGAKANHWVIRSHDGAECTKMRITGFLVNLLNLPAGPVLRRVSIVSAYVACGVLWWLSQLPGEGVGAEAARGWLVFMALPPWLLSCLIAIHSGNQLGNVWKWLAWPPLAVPTLYFTVNSLMQVDWSRLIGAEELL